MAKAITREAPTLLLIIEETKGKIIYESLDLSLRLN